MKYYIFLILVSSLYSCKPKSTHNVDKKLLFSIEKIIVHNTSEAGAVFFKLQVVNNSQEDIELYNKKLYDEAIPKRGFYLENSDNSLPLSVLHDGNIPVTAQKSNYYFLYKSNFKYTQPSDSLKLKEYLSDFKLKYNGRINSKKGNIDNTVLRDSFTVSLPKIILIRYVNQLPLSKKEWDEL